MFCDLVAFSLECCHRPECPIIQSCLSYIVIVALGTTTYIPLHQGHNLLKDRQNSAGSTKGSFFLRFESGHEFKLFPTKNQASDWLTWPSWFTNLRLGFGGKQLELMPCLRISEKPTFWKLILYWNISTTYFQILCHTLSHLFLSLWTWTDLVISTYGNWIRIGHGMNRHFSRQTFVYYV